MKRIALTLTLLILALGFAGAAVAAGDHDHGDGAFMVQGEVLDMACYVSHGAKGPDHAACAKRCAKGGQPIGLLADDGEVYLLYASHDDGSAFEATKELAGTKVMISGKKFEKGGITGIEVHEVKAL